MLPPSMVGLPYFREEIEDGESKVSCPMHHRQMDLFVPTQLQGQTANIIFFLIPYGRTRYGNCGASESRSCKISYKMNGGICKKN